MKLKPMSLKGVSMAPKYDVVFADLEAKYFLGSYVLDHLDDNQTTFKQLIIEGAHKFL